MSDSNDEQNSVEASASPHCSAAERPLTRDEQDDLFRQMGKWLSGNDGVIRERLFFACEVENMYRMMATIRQQRKTIGAGDTAMKQMDYAADRYREERDAAHHVIMEASVIPGVDYVCRCDQCASVARGMEKAGYLADFHRKWWDS